MSLYVTERVSSDKQDVESQRFGNSKYIKDNNLTVTQTFSEEGVSGRKVPISERLLGRIKTLCVKGDMILGYDQSRFARNQREWLNFVWWAQDTGVEIITAENGLKFGFGHDDLGTNAMSFFKSAETEATALIDAKKTSDAMQLRKQKIRDEGGFISNKSKWIEKLGNPNITTERFDRNGKRIPSIAELGRDAAAKAARLAMVNSPSIRQAYAMIKTLKSKGDSNSQIAFYLNTNGFKTVRGFDFLPSSIPQFVKRVERLKRTNQFV